MQRYSFLDSAMRVFVRRLFHYERVLLSGEMLKWIVLIWRERVKQSSSCVKTMLSYSRCVRRFLTNIHCAGSSKGLLTTTMTSYVPFWELWVNVIAFKCFSLKCVFRSAQWKVYYRRDHPQEGFCFLNEVLDHERGPPAYTES